MDSHARCGAQGGSLVDRFRAITYVLRQEAAVSLGMAGRKLRLALEHLARFDERAEGASSRRRELVQNAAYLLSAYVVQRETPSRSEEHTSELQSPLHIGLRPLP